MNRAWTLTFALVLGGAAGAGAYPYELSGEQTAAVQEHLPFGLPSKGELLFREGYVVSHNNWLKIPNWAAYHVSAWTLQGGAERGDNFQADPDLKPWQRSEPSDYRGSGLDQGHMAPAGAMKRSVSAMDASFLLSNMVPQIGAGFNRGIWRILEDKVRDWSVLQGDGWVVVGPAFVPSRNGTISFRTIGKNRVAVPSHCFMLLVTVDGQGNRDSIAFLVPNARIRGNDLRPYLTSIHEIERLTGLDFLSDLQEAEQDTLELPRASALWPTSAPASTAELSAFAPAGD